MTLRTSALFASLLLGLTACATPPGASAPTASAVTSAPSAAEPAPEYDPSSLPKLALDDELVMRFLIGDVAAQRGNLPLAAEAWVDLARRTKDPRVAQRAAQLSVASGQLALAQDATEIWTAAAPQALPARQLMISLLLRNGRIADAEVHLNAMFAAKPQEVAPFFVQMHQLWGKDVDREAVLQLTLRLTEAYAPMPEAHFARAVAYSNAQQPDLAQQELDAALKLRPLWEPAVLYKVQLNDGKDAASLDLLAAAAKANPMSSQITLAQARIAADTAQYQQAGQYYESVLARDPNQLEALVGAGLIAMQLNEVAKAQQYLTRSVQLNPKSAGHLAPYLGQLAEQRHQYALAIEWYGKAEGDRKAQSAQRLPRLYAKLGQQSKADQALRALPVTTTQEQIDKAQIEAQVWRERKDLSRAVATLTEAIARLPQEAELYYDRSLYLDLAGDTAGAEADLRQFLAMQPESVNGQNALGYILANRTNRYAEADTYLVKAYAQQPENPVILDSLGWLRFKQGKLSEALALLEKAYLAMPDAEVGAHLAEILWTKGDKARAKQILDEVLAIQPDDEVALEVRQRLGL
ncbi:tetratricopeptide repeat protein [Chitinibacter fontanus]|uniref:Tetratricopeptide repeat protein n=1 Tax=Chitinibacter fontanus TaxID=1737446 RepID=A0A7D5V9Y3_9NEIS|nr:tetratricopeptide repeat protein [Chitinibacter fontanus]QLI81735.1 tetratricopeptide repeat protein [Chitinibacter fontanus]